MNCLEFESHTEILARGTLADARTRAAAEAHEESCGPCAARLADERSLSTGLRALAAGMKTAEAPARVETALLSAFRARTATAVEGSGEAAATSNVVPVSEHAPARRWSWAKTIAVASLAAAASLALFVLVRPEASRPLPPTRAMLTPPSGPSGGLPPNRTVAPGGASSKVDEGVGSVNEPGRVTTPQRFTPRARATNVSYSNRGELSRPVQAAPAQEVATDFIPLVHNSPYTQNEDSHLVRVELPRSALASFGLPVNAEASGGSVKADVLMGQDGVARAIRFVR